MANQAKLLRNQLKNVTKDHVKDLLEAELILTVEKRLTQRVEDSFKKITDHIGSIFTSHKDGLQEHSYKTYIHLKALEEVMGKLLNKDDVNVTNMLAEAAQEIHKKTAEDLKNAQTPKGVEVELLSQEASPVEESKAE